MDFYVDLAVAVLLRLLRDRRAARPYFAALAKVTLRLNDLADTDKSFRDALDQAREKRDAVR